MHRPLLSFARLLVLPLLITTPARLLAQLGQIDLQSFCASHGSQSFCAALGDADSDGDGLCDSWERARGIDLNGDGKVDAVNDLPLPGASPHRKDVYLQYDFMVLPDQGTACAATSDCALSQNCVANVCRGHSHAPSPEALKAVIRAFGARGIAVHIVQGNSIPEARVLTYDPVVAACTGSDAVNFYDLKAVNFDSRRRFAYHYTIFGHYNTCDPYPDPVNCPEQANCCANCGPGVNVGSGGLAEQPGNDVIVSLGSILDAGVTPGVENVASVFMHELGHNFSLDHAGATSTPDFKPNFLSVMNLNFFFPGIPVAASPGSTTAKACSANDDCAALGGICSSAGTCTRIDYSRVALATLDETHLNETLGIGAGNNDITSYDCPDFTVAQGPGTGAIDWNCNGDSSEPDVAADVTAEGTLSPLLGFADWPNLKFAFQCTSGGSSDAPPPPSGLAQEMDFKTVLKRHLLHPLRSVRIEVSPGCASKAVAPGQPGSVSVALLGAADLDVAEVEPASLKFHGAAPLGIATSDVNGDGQADLLLTFDMGGLRLSPGSGPKSARLTGWLKNSQAFTGTAEVLIAPNLAWERCQ